VRGGYLADVDFVVRDRTALTFWGRADGPMCYLRMPAGSYRVEATYQGAKRMASVQAAAGPESDARRADLPRDPTDTIASVAGRKGPGRSARLAQVARSSWR